MQDDPKTGLLRQHLTAVRAAAALCGAQVQGDAIGSTELTFTPNLITPGDYNFAVGTAGSATLVLQTILPALMLGHSDDSRDGYPTGTNTTPTHNQHRTSFIQWDRRPACHPPKGRNPLQPYPRRGK